MKGLGFVHKVRITLWKDILEGRSTLGRSDLGFEESLESFEERSSLYLICKGGSMMWDMGNLCCETPPKGPIYRFSGTHGCVGVVRGSFEYEKSGKWDVTAVTSRPAAYFPCMPVDLVNPLKSWENSF